MDNFTNQTGHLSNQIWYSSMKARQFWNQIEQLRDQSERPPTRLKYFFAQEKCSKTFLKVLNLPASASEHTVLKIIQKFWLLKNNNNNLFYNA